MEAMTLEHMRIFSTNIKKVVTVRETSGQA